MTSPIGSFKGKHRKLTVKLLRRDQLFITAMLKEGGDTRRIFRRGQVLTLLHQGNKPKFIAERLRMSAKGVRAIGWRYCEGGLHQALKGKPRTSIMRKFDESQQQAIHRMIVGPAPDGYSRWTVRLATAEVLRRGLAKIISRETVRLIIVQSRT